MIRITSLILRSGGCQFKQWNLKKVEKISQKFSQPSVYSCCTGVKIVTRPYSDLSNVRDPLNNLPLYDEKKGKLIYSGNLTKPVKGAKIFSWSTSMIGVGLGLGLIPYIVFSLKDDIYMTILIAVSSFNIIAPLLMHFVTKQYIISIYYNEDTKIFTATSFSLFVRKKDHVFMAKDVDFNPGAFSNITIKGFPLFLDESLFFDYKSYYEIMTLDKPITDFIKKDKE